MKSFIECWNDAYNLFSKLDEQEIFYHGHNRKEFRIKNTTVEGCRKDMKLRTSLCYNILNDTGFIRLGATF